MNGRQTVWIPQIILLGAKGIVTMCGQRLNEDEPRTHFLGIHSCVRIGHFRICSEP